MITKFDRLFPEDTKEERIIKLKNTLSNEVLTGDYTNIPLDSLQERLADTESFWNGLQALVIAYHTKHDSVKQKLDSFMGVVHGLADDVAYDSAPVIEKLMIDRAEEEQAADIYDRMAS